MSDDAPGAGEPIEIHSCDDVLSHVFEFLDHETGRRPARGDRRAPGGLLLLPARVRHRAGVQGAGPPPLRRRRPAGRSAGADQGPADHRLLRGGRHAGQRRADHRRDREPRERLTAARGAPRPPAVAVRALRALERAVLRRWAACRGWRRSSCGSDACVLAWTSLPSSRRAVGRAIGPWFSRAGTAHEDVRGVAGTAKLTR